MFFSLEQRREKRARTSSLYLDTLNITMLRKQNKLLLRAAVWKIQDGRKLTLVEKDSLPKFLDSDGVIFITTEKECDLLEGLGIKCPVSRSKGEASNRSSLPLDSPKMQAVVGASAAILLVIIVIVFVYCLRRRRKRSREVWTAWLRIAKAIKVSQV